MPFTVFTQTLYPVNLLKAVTVVGNCCGLVGKLVKVLGPIKISQDLLDVLCTFRACIMYQLHSAAISLDQ